MALLTEHVSAKTRVLEVLFPNGQWRTLLAEIAWELLDLLVAAGDKFTFKKWGLTITLPRFIVEAIITRLFGPRP